MTWTAASPGFPAAFSFPARGGGAAASPGNATAQPCASPGGQGGLRRPSGRKDTLVPRKRPGGEAGAPGFGSEGCAGAQRSRAPGRHLPPLPALPGSPGLPRPSPRLKGFSARRSAFLFGLFWCPRDDGRVPAKVRLGPSLRGCSSAGPARQRGHGSSETSS